MQELASAASSVHAFNGIWFPRGINFNKMHIAQDEYEGEIARIMAKSLYDAEINITGDLGFWFQNGETPFAV